MAIQAQDDPAKDTAQQEQSKLSGKIGDHVLRALGQPSEFHRLQIRRLWKDHYRVNVFIGVDFASSKVAQSFFVVGDGDGNILSSNPKITR